MYRCPDIDGSGLFRFGHWTRAAGPLWCLWASIPGAPEVFPGAAWCPAATVTSRGPGAESHTAFFWFPEVPHRSAGPPSSGGSPENPLPTFPVLCGLLLGPHLLCLCPLPPSCKDPGIHLGPAGPSGVISQLKVPFASAGDKAGLGHERVRGPWSAYHGVCIYNK